MATDNESNTGFVFALVGAGAALAWLLWRGRGARKAGEQPNPRSDAGPAVVRICSGDRVKVDGVSLDLAAVVERVGRAGVADVFAAGDARHGWVMQVRDALQATQALIRWHGGGVAS